MEESSKCVRRQADYDVDPDEFYCCYYKEEMDISCSGKNTKNTDVPPSNQFESTSMQSSNTLVRDGGIVDGLETFNGSAKKKTRPDERDIIRQQCEECVSKCGDDASCGSKKTTKSADISPSIFEYLCLIP